MSYLSHPELTKDNIFLVLSQLGTKIDLARTTSQSES